jgi:transposase-like protein
MSEYLICKYCRSSPVIKYGVYKGVQRYFCRICNRKFVSENTIPKMKTPTKDIADSLNMHYEGMSERGIRRNFIQRDKNYISTGSIYNWIKRFTILAIKESEKYQPKVGDMWIAGETLVRVDKRKHKDTKARNLDHELYKSRRVVSWDIIDSDSRFLLASLITTTRGKADAQLLVEKAAKRAGKVPKVLITDKLSAHLCDIELDYCDDTKQSLDDPFTIENNIHFIERLYASLADRRKVMKALKNEDALQQFADGWLVHYNFFRPHMALNEKTPAEMAGINFPLKNWRNVVEQPFHLTARIPIKRG